VVAEALKPGGRPLQEAAEAGCRCPPGFVKEFSPADQGRERIFMDNSILGFVGYLEEQGLAGS
jgi:hypothetical protein